MDQLADVPIHALSATTRQLLSQYLNPEQVLLARSGLPRDHRGLAEQAGLSYAEVKNYQRSSDPTSALLNALQKFDAEKRTLKNILEMLEKIERFDVCDDIYEQFMHDASVFKSKLLHITENGHSESSLNRTIENGLTPLTIHDVVGAQPTFYDAYVCYADADVEFVHRMTNFLEVEHGLKLLLRDRDLLIGSLEQDAIIRLIEQRCRRMIIILTPDFLASNECEFQTRFAMSIAVEQRARILIPVIYKKCNELPSVIKFLTKIDLSRDGPTSEWNWRKLVLSVKNADNASKPALLPKCSVMITEVPSSESNQSTTCSEKGQSVPYSQTTTAEIDKMLEKLPSYSDLPSPTQTSGLSTTSSISSAAASPKKRGWIKSIKQKISKSAYAQLDS